MAVYSGPPLDAVRSKVASFFQVRDAFLDPNGVPTFVVNPEPTKHKFLSLVEQLRADGLIAAIRSTGEALTIKVFSRPRIKPSRRSINLGLFFVTLVTVAIAGYFVWTGTLFGLGSVKEQYNAIVSPGASPYFEAAVFAAGLLAIIGLHEFGHKTTAVVHKMDATFPYFIPGPPPIGTFGALISLRGAPANRDQLFDLGISGPIVGFIVTIVVAMVAMLLGPAATSAKIDQINALAANCNCLSGITFPSTPLILVLLSNLSSSINPNVFYDQQLFFAAQIGALLTFLNIVPAWQLDGGHISRAVFGPNGHRKATIFGLVLLMLLGYIFQTITFITFAFFVLLMMFFTGRGLAGVEPLDDVSSVSNSRKAIYLMGIIMLILTFAAY